MVEHGYDMLGSGKEIPMHPLAVEEASTRLDELMEQAAGGGEVVITRDDGAAFKIVPVKSRRVRPKFGSAEGLIEMSEDFDDPIEDFQDYER